MSESNSALLTTFAGRWGLRGDAGYRSCFLAVREQREDLREELRTWLLRARLFYSGRRPLALWGLMGYNWAEDIYMNLIGVGQAVDAVVVTPEDVERYGDCPALIIEPALREGKVVYGS
jgi:hypothetical protein